MTKRLTIYLHSALPLQTSFVIQDEDGAITSSEFLPENVDNFTINVFVPTEDVLITSTELPKLNRQRLLQALPFAIEEQLLDEVSDLHFAIEDYQADGKVPTVIVSKNKMREWLDALSEKNIFPSSLTPLVFALPYIENSTTINCYDEHCLVRTGKYAGFAAEKNNLDALIDTTGIDIKNLSTMELLKQTSPTTPSINLLQGNFKAKRKTSSAKKTWTTAGYLFLLALFILFFSELVSFMLLEKHNNQITEEINKIYLRNFPKSRVVIAPRERMQDKLKSMTSLASKNNFLALLAKVGEGLSESHGIRIQSLDFRDQQLSLEISGATFDNLDAFAQALQKQSLSVKQQNATVAGTQVKATFLIRAGSS